MRLTIYTVDGESLEVENFEESTLMDMLDALKQEEQSFLQFSLDDVGAISVISRAHITRIDLDPNTLE